MIPKPPPYEQVVQDVRHRVAGKAACHPERKHRALGMCDPCYQKHRYWANPESNRAAARRSVQLTRLKRKGVPPKVAKRMIDLMEAERGD